MDGSFKRIPALLLIVGVMAFGGVRVRIGGRPSAEASNAANNSELHKQVDAKAAQW